MVTMTNAAAKMAIPRCHDPAHAGRDHTGMDHARFAELGLALGIAGAGGGTNSGARMTGTSAALGARSKPLGRKSLAGNSLGPDFCADCGICGLAPPATSCMANSRSAACTPGAGAGSPLVFRCIEAHADLRSRSSCSMLW